MIRLSSIILKSFCSVYSFTGQSDSVFNIHRMLPLSECYVDPRKVDLPVGTIAITRPRQL